MRTNDKNLIFHKLGELKKLTIRQKKSIMAGDIDIYISIERFRSDLRKEIDEIKDRTAFNLQEFKTYHSMINELAGLENENRRLLLDWGESLKLEKNNIRKFKKVSAVYFSENKIPARSRFVNQIT